MVGDPRGRTTMNNGGMTGGDVTPDNLEFDLE